MKHLAATFLVLLLSSTAVHAQKSTEAQNKEQLEASAYALAIELFGQGGEVEIKYDGAEHRFMKTALETVRKNHPDKDVLRMGWMYATLGIKSSSYIPEEQGGTYTRAAFSKLVHQYHSLSKDHHVQEEQSIRAILEGCPWCHHETEYEFHYSTETPTRYLNTSDVLEVSFADDVRGSERLICKNEMAKRLKMLGIRKVVISKSYSNLGLQEAPTDGKLERMTIYAMAGSFDNNDMSYIQHQLAKTPGYEAFKGFEVDTDGVGGIPEELAMDIRLVERTPQNLETGVFTPFVLEYHPSHFSARSTQVRLTPSRQPDGTIVFKTENLGEFPTTAQILAPLRPMDRRSMRLAGMDEAGMSCSLTVKGDSVEIASQKPGASFSIPFGAGIEFRDVLLYKQGLEVSVSQSVQGKTWYYTLSTSLDPKTGAAKSFSASIIRNGVQGAGAYVSVSCKSLQEQ